MDWKLCENGCCECESINLVKYNFPWVNTVGVLNNKDIIEYLRESLGVSKKPVKEWSVWLQLVNKTLKEHL